jgi:hypothetical protein
MSDPSKMAWLKMSQATEKKNRLGDHDWSLRCLYSQAAISTLVTSDRVTDLVWRWNEDNVQSIPPKGGNEETWDANQLPKGFKEFLYTTDNQLPKKEEGTPPPIHHEGKK